MEEDSMKEKYGKAITAFKAMVNITTGEEQEKYLSAINDWPA